MCEPVDASGKSGAGRAFRGRTGGGPDLPEVLYDHFSEQFQTSCGAFGGPSPWGRLGGGGGVWETGSKGFQCTMRWCPEASARCVFQSQCPLPFRRTSLASQAFPDLLWAKFGCRCASLLTPFFSHKLDRFCRIAVRRCRMYAASCTHMPWQWHGRCLRDQECNVGLRGACGSSEAFGGMTVQVKCTRSSSKHPHHASQGRRAGGARHAAPRTPSPPPPPGGCRAAACRTVSQPEVRMMT